MIAKCKLDNVKIPAKRFINRAYRRNFGLLVGCTTVATFATTTSGVGFVGDVHEGDVEDVDDVLVVERIVYVFAFAAALHQVVVLQEFELVGDGRLRHADRVCDVVDADFFVGDRA